MSGHGHVTPNPDGSKARCGGKMLCSECAAEWVAEQEKADAQLAVEFPGVPPMLAAEGITPDDYAKINEARRLADQVTAGLTDRGSPLLFVVALVTAHERSPWPQPDEFSETGR